MNGAGDEDVYNTNEPHRDWLQPDINSRKMLEHRSGNNQALLTTGQALDTQLGKRIKLLQFRIINEYPGLVSLLSFS